MGKIDENQRLNFGVQMSIVTVDAGLCPAEFRILLSLYLCQKEILKFILNSLDK